MRTVYQCGYKSCPEYGRLVSFSGGKRRVFCDSNPDAVYDKTISDFSLIEYRYSANSGCGRELAAVEDLREQENAIRLRQVLNRTKN